MFSDFLTFSRQIIDFESLKHVSQFPVSVVSGKRNLHFAGTSRTPVSRRTLLWLPYNKWVLKRIIDFTCSGCTLYLHFIYQVLSPTCPWLYILDALILILSDLWFCQDSSCVCCIGKANLYPEIYRISALACFKRVLLPCRTQLIELHGIGTTWFQTSGNCRAELNSYIINTLEYILRVP